ncbi:hypothetical protein [Sandarakinorhabdus sp.]|uniref:hypothetical protein n=1 Tax=Sandarakinorhabdus sp. TaxID=1916663 RepID=UPI003F707F81
MIGGGPPRPESYFETALGSGLLSAASLDDEIKRLIRRHGKEAVAKAAKKLTKPNLRAEPEIQDYRALEPILREEARRLLNGEPARSRTQLAELAAPAVKHKQSHSSVITRLLRRLSTPRCATYRAIYALEVAKAEFSVRTLIPLCRKSEGIAGADSLAKHYLEKMNDAVIAIEEAGDPIPTNPTYDELLAAGTRASVKRNFGPLMHALSIGKPDH